MNDCRWPELPEPYGEALREAVRYVLSRFEPMGIVACGTVIRGRPDRSSDLDIYVLVSEPMRQRIQRFFGGVPTELFVNPRLAVERYFEEELAWGRPTTAHMLATGFVVLDRDPEVESLRSLAREYLQRKPDFDRERRTAIRYAAAILYEDAVDVMETDPETCTMILGEAVSTMLQLVFFANVNRPIPRRKELLETIARIDSEVAELGFGFYHTAELSKRVELAGQLAERTIGSRGFFEWESTPEPVK